MIAVDSSALMAILLNEPFAPQCREALADDTEPLISAVALAETFIVSRTRDVLLDLSALLSAVPFNVIPTDEETAARVSSIQARWGKGRHAAKLNFVDCFSYDVARQFGCPLLFIGNYFSQTDIQSALAL